MMKRDWEVIRDILVKIEEGEENLCDSFTVENKDIYIYHIILLIEAELIKGQVKKSLNCGARCRVDSLTWQGHDFLDAIRSDTIWKKTKLLLKEKSLGMTFEIVKKAAMKFTEEMI